MGLNLFPDQGFGDILVQPIEAKTNKGHLSLYMFGPKEY